ncbi:MAG: sulfotransferase [Verrucomicrobia bacterium]|nr:sulfotransferase [Verrucomicrobiota bacterium]
MSSLPQPSGSAVLDRKTLGSKFGRQIWRLNIDTLCAEAKRRTRFEDFGDPPLDPALTILVNSLELETGLHPLGRFLLLVHLRGLLETRLRLTNIWNRHAEVIAAEGIQRPIFITGMPRSGSTFLHELLSADPENRAPRAWEVMFPIADGRQSTRELNSRVRNAEFSLWCFRRLAPGADSVYPMRAWTPQECIAIHSYTFLSEEFGTTCHVPTYKTFLHGANLVPTYAWQKRFLQYLQLGCLHRRWVLKSPNHVYSLDKLLSVFPDALIVRTHRHPIDVIKSQIELIKVLEGMFARRRDDHEIVSREVRTIQEMVDNILRFQDKCPQNSGQFVDVNYSELVSDPIGIIQRIYNRLEISPSERAITQIRRLSLNRSRYRRRNGQSKSTDSILNRTVDTSRFEPYCSQFGVS